METGDRLGGRQDIAREETGDGLGEQTGDRLGVETGDRLEEILDTG